MRERPLRVRRHFNSLAAALARDYTNLLAAADREES
jgi:hypothetical protein